MVKLITNVCAWYRCTWRQLVYTVGALVWTMAFMLPAELRYEIFPFRT